MYEEYLPIIERVVNRLAKRFVFGYHQEDDLKQYAYMKAFELIASNRWDGVRPLENFLYRHVRNRLINWKRDTYHRAEKPCKNCPFYDPKFLKSENQCAAFIERMSCKRYASWYLRNLAKRGLSNLIDIGNVSESEISVENSVGDAYDKKEIQESPKEQSIKSPIKRKNTSPVFPVARLLAANGSWQPRHAFAPRHQKGNTQFHAPRSPYS